MNSYNFIGRITTDLELKKTPSDVSLVNFMVAIDRYNGKNKEKTADFIPISAYRSDAENIVKFFSKGSMIGITGNIKTDTYEKNGEKRYTWKVQLERFYFTGGKRETANSGEQPAAQQPAPSYSSADNSDFEEVVDDDDLPF